MRDSSLELLRIVAMLFILLLHANFLAFGFPSQAELLAHPLRGFLQLSAETLCCVAVNSFVLISGFFGIRLQGKSLAGLLFQSAFYGALAYLLSLLLPLMLPSKLSLGIPPDFSLGKFLASSFPLSQTSGWFLPVYVGLMLLSPLLNRALERLTTRELGRYLLLFYSFHTIWVFLLKTMDKEDGYSIFSFVGIYLLGAYLRRTKHRWRKVRRWKFLLGYIGISLLATASYLAVSQLTGMGLNSGPLPYWMMSYASPLVIAASVCLFLSFAGRSFHSSLINGVAGSTLAVYLLHCNDYVIPYYLRIVQGLYSESLPDFLVLLLGFVGFVFVGCILIDQLRLLLWRYTLLPLYLHLEARFRRKLS